MTALDFTPNLQGELGRFYFSSQGHTSRTDKAVDPTDPNREMVGDHRAAK